MQGEKAENIMSKNKDLAKELAALSQAAIASGTVQVETIPAVEPEETDDAVTLSGRMLPIGDAVTYLKSENCLRLDLVSLRGHRIDDVTNVPGFGDVRVSASFGRLKAQPKVDTQAIRDAHRMNLLSQAETAFNQGDKATAKLLYAEVNGMSERVIPVNVDSGIDSFDVDLGNGRIIGDRFQFAKSSKDDALIYVDGLAHRLRYTVSRGLFKSEAPKTTKRQRERAITRAEKESKNAALLAATKLQGQREYQLLLDEQKSAL